MNITKEEIEETLQHIYSYIKRREDIDRVFDVCHIALEWREYANSHLSRECAYVLDELLSGKRPREEKK